MRRYFVTADVHGFYNELQSALNDAGFDINNPDHVFVSLGDLFDRGRQPQECLDFVMNLPEDRRILIMGNHELLMEDMLRRGSARSHDIHNGTTQTIKDLTGEHDTNVAIQMMRLNKQWAEYFHSCVFYYELGDNIFVHGWIPMIYEHDKWGNKLGAESYDPAWRVADWEDATWENGMSAWNYGIIEPGKTIWCGHWHTSWGNSRFHKLGKEFPEDEAEKKIVFSPFIDEGIVAMDACTAYSGFVNVKEIDYE